MEREIIYTADNEMPVCIQCDNFDNTHNCCKFCGPEYGWYAYKRTERIEEDGREGI